MKPRKYSKTKSSAHRAAVVAQVYGGPAHLISLHVETSEPDQWLEMIPAGTFTGRDGRGPFENKDPHAVVVATNKLNMTVGIPVDYDHATDYAAPKGGPAPAAGWIKALRVQHGAVWGQVEWTPDGAGHVKNKHWRYISPVFEFKEQANGKLEVTCLLRAALTNNPNLELQAIAAARAENDPSIHRRRKNASLSERAKSVERAFPHLSMEQAIDMIQYAAHLEDDDADDSDALDAMIVNLTNDEGDDDMDDLNAMSMDDDDDEAMASEAASMLSENAALGAAKEDDAAMAKKILERSKQRRAEHRAKKDAEASAAAAACPKDESAAHAKAALKKLFPHFSDDKIEKLAAHAKVDGSNIGNGVTVADQTVISLQAEVTNLKNINATKDATMAVDKAIDDHKLTPALREWGLDLATRDLAAFSAYVSKAPLVAAGGPAVDGDPKGVKTGAAPDKIVREICSGLGLDPKAYVAYRNENRTNKASMAFDPSA